MTVKFKKHYSFTEIEIVGYEVEQGVIQGLKKTIQETKELYAIGLQNKETRLYYLRGALRASMALKMLTDKDSLYLATTIHLSRMQKF